MVTDQPVMHLARELTTMVEYVPTCAESVDSDFASARLAELRRLYAATIYVRLRPELKAPLS